METSGARKWWTLAPLVLAVLVVALDATIVSVALPTLAGALHASTGDLQWFVAAYTLVFAAALVPGGMLGDRYGRKKLLLGALVVFGGGSLGCALSPSAGAFIAARAVLGLGGAIIFPMTIGVLPVLFADAERPKAVAVTMAATVLGFPIGPILGGWMLSHVHWSWVFLMNVPVVLIAILAVVFLMPETRASEKPRFDPLGIAASSAGLALLTYGVIEAGERGWGTPAALGEMVGGVLVLGAFLLWERRARDPLFDLSLFGSRAFTWGTFLATLVSFAMFGLLFTVPQYFQAVRGTTAQGAGLGLLPLVGGLLVGAVFADRITVRSGAKLTVGLGFTLAASGLFLGTATRAGSGLALAICWTAVFGLGLGLVLPSAMDAALGSVSRERSGVGSGMIQALRMIGSNFGAAILGSVLNSVYIGHLDLAGLSQGAQAAKESVEAGVAAAGQLGSPELLDSVKTAFVHGMDVLLMVCGGLAAVGIALALVFLPGGRRGDEAPAMPEVGHGHEDAEQHA
jgi:DHA2 family multidrug resistance protein-like MFS transporter